jgi:signal transduction histidine kinase/ActR/RegA family two-component response regulator
MAMVQPSSRTLLTLGAVLTLGLAVLVLSDTMNARSIATAEAQRSLATTAKIIAAHARRTLADVSAVVRAEPFPAGAGPHSEADRAWLERVKAATRSMPQVAGVELHNSRSFAGKPRNPSQQWLGNPARSPVTGQLLLPLIHKLGASPDAPVLIASIDLGAFHAFYRSIENLSETTTALLLDDGTLLASDDVDIPVGATRLPELTRWLQAGSDLSQGGILHDEVGAVVRIPEFGLAVITRRKLSAALEPWGDQALGVAIPAAILAGLALLLLYLTRRQLLRLESDTLERRRLELEKEELRRSLQHAGRIDSLGRLATGIAHDFSNVLSAILGYGELARDHSIANPAVRRYAERIVSAAQRGKSLVERLLAFVRAERGPTRVTAVDPLVRETLDMVDASLQPRLRLERSCAAGSATVRAAPTELHQIVMNLLSNALHAVRDSGVVEVSTRVEELTMPLRVRTGSIGPGMFVRLEVSDTGHGIAPEVIEHIFEPFFTTKVAGGGTGVGLALVKQLVDELGGAIDVRTQVGAGTTFTVLLPCDPRGQEPQSRPDSVVRGNGATILVVDDDRALVELSEELLAALGYEPVGFASSADAWETFQRTPERFDAVLTDEVMPHPSGTELAHLVRSLRTDIPIIVMSGFVPADRVEQLEALGIEHILRKPLSASELSRALAAALQNRAAAVSA